MSSYFWNSGPMPPTPAGGGGSGWGGWGGMYQGPHGIQGVGGVPGGAHAPTPLPWVQNLLNAQQGPLDRINTSGLPPFWQQIGLSAAPGGATGTGGITPGMPIVGEGGNPPIVTQHGAGFTFNGGHSPLGNPTGSGTATNMGPPPPPGPTPNPPVQDGPIPHFPPGVTPQMLSSYYNYIMRRWPGWGGGFGNPGGAQ